MAFNLGMSPMRIALTLGLALLAVYLANNVTAINNLTRPRA
jgi:hypothetical protein